MPFIDVPPGSWSYPSITRIAEMGYLRGYPDGTFKPEAPITREETAVIIDRLMFGWHDLVNEIDAAMITVLSPWGSGSGVHIGEHLIITNHHVVARQVGHSWEIPDTFTFYNSTADPRSQLPMIAQAKAEYVAGSPKYDLAVLRRTDYLNIVLPSIPLAEPRHIRTGETVVAVGSPYGLERTVTQGIVSHPARHIDYWDDSTRMKAILLQTDAPINPGNSGGALVNIAGHLIGVPSMRYDPSDGLGFAIRIDSVIEFLNANDIPFEAV